MVQILDRSGAGSRLASGLTQGVAHLLERKRLSMGLETLGFSPEEAMKISSLDPQIRNELSMRKINAPREQQYAQMLQSILGGNQGSQGTTVGTPQANESLIGQGSEGMNPQGQAQQFQGQQGQAQGQSPFNLPSGIDPKQALELTKLAIDKKNRGYDATKAFRSDVTKGKSQARGSIKDIQRLRELDEKGDLDNAGYVEGLKKAGIDVPALLNPDSQEFNKIKENYVRNASAYYGGNVTDQQMLQFLNTIPSLSNSREGRKRIYANMEYLDRAKEANFEAMREITRENGGNPPEDLAERVEERIGPKLEMLAKKFKEELNRPLPKGKDKFDWDSYALGTILGGVKDVGGYALKKGAGALAGAAGGSAFGQPGIGALSGILGS